MGFWEGLGNVVPKKGYSKHTRKLARKFSNKPVGTGMHSKLVKMRKEEAKRQKEDEKAIKGFIAIPKSGHATYGRKKGTAKKWRPMRTVSDKSYALSIAKHYREDHGYQTRVDGTARGYQVWIKS